MNVLIRNSSNYLSPKYSSDDTPLMTKIQLKFPTFNLSHGRLGNSLDKLRHTRSVAYSVELVLLNKHQISGGGAYLDYYRQLFQSQKSDSDNRCCACRFTTMQQKPKLTITITYYSICISDEFAVWWVDRYPRNTGKHSWKLLNVSVLLEKCQWIQTPPQTCHWLFSRSRASCSTDTVVFPCQGYSAYRTTHRQTNSRSVKSQTG